MVFKSLDKRLLMIIIQEQANFVNIWSDVSKYHYLLGYSERFFAPKKFDMAAGRGAGKSRRNKVDN